MLASSVESETRFIETAAEGRWSRLALTMATKLQSGALTIELANGARHRIRGAAPGPEGHLRLHRERAIRRFITGGRLGFSEAYLDGDWDSDDLARLLELMSRNEQVYDDLDGGSLWRRIPARLQHLVRVNTRRGSRRNILAHYDLSNDFYRRWLDRSMTYSSAQFAHPDMTLEEAQQAKYRAIVERLELRPHHHLLEIGCGWGGFAEFVGREVGARVTAITISEAQHAHAAERIQAAGLSDRVDVRLLDYRDVADVYDRIASIEMFEAVGERYWPTYFGKLRSCLRPEGRATLQVITIADRYFQSYRKGVDFIQRHVFPGGMLPSPGVLQREIARAGLRPIAEVAFGLDYARTLAEWGRRFRGAWPDIVRLGFDHRFRRLWDYYLAYCETGFRVGYTDVRQITLEPV
jgi:cyclopropane-fatty-acyl-phospholipid synthase